MLYLPLLHGGHSSAEQAPPRVMAVPRGRPTRRLTGSPSAAVVHPTQACNRARARRCCPLLPSRSADGGEEHGERTPRWHSRLRSSPKVPNAALCCDSSAILLNLWSTSRGAPQIEEDRTRITAQRRVGNFGTGSESRVPPRRALSMLFATVGASRGEQRAAAAGTSTVAGLSRVNNSR